MAKALGLTSPVHRRRYDSLPGLAFPGDPNGYPTRDEAIAYLEQYAKTFDLPVELNSAARTLAAENGRYLLEVGGATITADQVVVATGPFQTPNVPNVADELAPEVFQAHSIYYRRPSDLPEGRILIIGGGNTGFQIAKELSATHRVYLSVGSRQTPLPQRFLGRDLFWWLTKSRLLNTTVESRLGRRLQYRDTLIGSSPRELKRRYGVELRPRVVDASEHTVRFTDRSELEVDAVIWATGYRPDHSWIDLPSSTRRADPPQARRYGRAGPLLSRPHVAAHAWPALLGWVKTTQSSSLARSRNASKLPLAPRLPSKRARFWPFVALHLSGLVAFRPASAPCRLSSFTLTRWRHGWCHAKASPTRAFASPRMRAWLATGWTWPRRGNRGSPDRCQFGRSSSDWSRSSSRRSCRNPRPCWRGDASVCAR